VASAEYPKKTQPKQVLWARKGHQGDPTGKSGQKGKIVSEPVKRNVKGGSFIFQDGRDQ